MGRMSFTQELKVLAKVSEGMDAGGCWREVIFLHQELVCVGGILSPRRRGTPRAGG